MSGEKWKDIAGYEGLYQVSNLGRVKSLRRMLLIRHPVGDRYREQPERILAPGPAESGHLTVSLAKEGRSKTYQVHTLVLEAFVGPRPGDCLEWHGCHRDGNPTNNVLGNLRWDTRSGNEEDKIAHGRSNRGERNRAVKLTPAQVLEIRERVAKGETSDAIAAIYGVTRGLINAIKSGRAWGWL
jgi:hypothetical protein